MPISEIISLAYELFCVLLFFCVIKLFLHFTTAGETENQEHVIFIFGKYLPVPSSTCTKKQLDHFKRYFIFVMDELAEK